MYKKGDPPVININVLLLDPQKTHISMIGDIGHRDLSHQPGKESKGQQEQGIEYIGTADNLFYF